MPSGLAPPYSYLFKDLDTDFMASIIPEIDQNGTGFNMTSPCVIRMKTCNAPKIGLTGNASTYESCIIFDIMCVKNYNSSMKDKPLNYTQVISINTKQYIEANVTSSIC